MKKLAIAALAAFTATMAFAGAASAAPFAPENINARQARLEQRIDFGLSSGRLTLWEARGLHAELNRVARIEANYRRGGLNFAERNDLNRRLDRVQFDIQRQMHDHDHRGYR